jgi:mono/diheme cytochrome c family protein
MSKINLYLLLVLSVASQVSCVSQTRKETPSTPGSGPAGSITRPAASVDKETAEPSLTLVAPGQQRHFSRSELLRSPHLKKLTVGKDPAYAGRSMTYEVVPLADLLEGLKLHPDETLLFSCLDGFSAPLSLTKILNRDPRHAIAYVAIERADAKWPALKTSSPDSAGPFYLVWERPEASNIGREEWPFQLAGFELKPSIETQFPHIVPAARVPATSPIRDGYRVFVKNCFACHTMNGEGAAQVGPDLNIPHNPTEYLAPGFLAKLIRNPQDLRHWPQAKMSAFDKSAISAAELAHLIAYLKHMASRKKPLVQE